MTFKRIEINGLRGFASKQTLNFGFPTGEVGSGLTIVVGPNNSGKSTVIESINAFTTNEPPGFSGGKRNIGNGNKIEISIFNVDEQQITLKTLDTGGSETEFVEAGILINTVKPFIVPSRRMFEPYFGKNTRDRNTHIVNYVLPAQRGRGFNEFAFRLFQIQKDQEPFNIVLDKVLGIRPKWYIDMADNGQYYLKFVYDQSEHNSDGAGEGLLSTFIIVDALYDSVPGDLIVIDEPELSIHPGLQKKLLQLLIEYSKDRQIVISTHSPYFISWDAIVNGANIARVVKEKNGSKIYQLTPPIIASIKASLGGLNNPHTYGLIASEVFFLYENIILVEGQEDVVIYRKILLDLGIKLEGDFYGWGVGGADNMKNIAGILKDLGFKKVVGILDADKAANIPGLLALFPTYSFLSINKDDVRDKNETVAKPAKEGLAGTDGKIKPENIENITQIFAETITYFKKE